MRMLTFTLCLAWTIALHVALGRWLVACCTQYVPITSYHAGAYMAVFAIISRCAYWWVFEDSDVHERRIT
jgi:purine-cytosine permease-like protein